MSRTVKASLLTLFFAVCAAALIIVHAIREPLPAPLPRDLFAVVTEQLNSVRAADYQNAYRHAATAVQQKFTLPQFQKMVRRSFSAAAVAQRVEFGLVQVQSGSAVVQVFFFAPDESVRVFLYSLTFEDEVWKIDGVEEVRGSLRASGTLS